ncbi:creatininase family protein [Microbacterium sp. P03]|uniref:creatininase family protein n=1 Tax=Microbacterium sp. P03 TaxID=3366946 RepID=UPI003744CAF4
MSIPTTSSVERLSPQEIQDRLGASPVAYLPMGSLEFHGPHLPIGLDALTAHGVCAGAADLTGGVVLPAVYQAVGGEHTAYPWTIMSSSPDAISTLLGETLARLADFGVKRTVILSGHFADGQRDLITRVAERWSERATTMSVVARTLGQAPQPPVTPDHAGRFESLLLHAIDPALVHPEALPDVTHHPAPLGEDPFGADRHRPEHPLHGVFGPDPRRLDRAAAAPLWEHLVGWVAGLATRD